MAISYQHNIEVVTNAYNNGTIGFIEFIKHKLYWGLLNFDKTYGKDAGTLLFIGIIALIVCFIYFSVWYFKNIFKKN